MAKLLRRGDRELASSVRGDCRIAFGPRGAIRGGGALARAGGSPVGNGAEALALVLQTPSPVLLLANALLPRVDGESVVRFMRAGQIDVPAILLGDSPELVARLRGLRIPDTAVDSTDVELPDLRAAVSQMVARSIEPTSSTDAATSEPMVRRRVLDRDAGREALVREWARVERERKIPGCRVVQRGSV